MAQLGYALRWTCEQCGKKNTQYLSKRDAAFFDSQRPAQRCKTCRSRIGPSRSLALPKIDRELLEIWFAEEDHCFLSQDEDLLIADADLSELKSFLFQPENREQRASALGPCLAVKLYDGNLSDTDQAWLIDWLRENGQHWQGHTMDYIKKRVHRILGDAE